MGGAWHSWQGVKRGADGQKGDRGIQGLEQWWRTRHGGTRNKRGITEEERREETQVRVRDEIFRERKIVGGLRDGENGKKMQVAPKLSQLPYPHKEKRLSENTHF